MRYPRLRLAVTAGLGALALALSAPSASAQPSDLCAAVEGLCAANHHATDAAFRAAIGEAAAARYDAAREALASGSMHARDSLVAGAIRSGAALRPDQSNRINLGTTLGNNNAGAQQPPPDTSRFGPQGTQEGALERGFAGTQERLGSNRQRMGTGAAGAARSMIPDAGIPSRGSLVGDGEATRPAVVRDDSKPNASGGVDRVTQRSDGKETMTQTGVNQDGSSYTQTDTRSAGGGHTRELTVYSSDGTYIYSQTSMRESSTGAYTHVIRESFDGGRTYHDTATVRGVGFEPTMQYGPNQRPAPTNVDPDSTSGGSGSNPCVLANPNCNIPLLIRFHQNRPDRRGRPSEEAGGVVPRIAPNTRGNVINPSPVEGAASGGFEGPRSNRSYDGGRIVNPGRDPD